MLVPDLHSNKYKKKKKSTEVEQFGQTAKILPKGLARWLSKYLLPSLMAQIQYLEPIRMKDLHIHTSFKRNQTCRSMGRKQAGYLYECLLYSAVYNNRRGAQVSKLKMITPVNDISKFQFYFIYCFFLRQSLFINQFVFEAGSLMQPQLSWNQAGLQLTENSPASVLK